MRSGTLPVVAGRQVMTDLGYFKAQLTHLFERRGLLFSRKVTKPVTNTNSKFLDTHYDRIIKHKTGLLNLAGKFGNITKTSEMLDLL